MLINAHLLEVVLVYKVPHDRHVAVTSLRDGGAVGQGTGVVYQSPAPRPRGGQSISLPLTL